MSEVAEQGRFELELQVLRLVVARMQDPREGGVSRSKLSESLRFIQSTKGGLISIATAWEKAERSRTWTNPILLAEQALGHLPTEAIAPTLLALQTPLVGEELDSAVRALDKLLLAGYKHRLTKTLHDAPTIPDALERVRKEGSKLRKTEIPSLSDLLAEAISKDTTTDLSGFTIKEDLVSPTGADWLNSWASPSRRFTAGSTVLIGGASSSGKTTLGNIFAISALEQGLPVFFYQAELAPWRHLRDLIILSKRKDRKDRLKATDTLPSKWIWTKGREKEDLLQYPALSNDIRHKDVMLAALESWADAWERRLSDSSNSCKGVVLLDYVQLIKDESARSDYTALEAVASELAQLAATRSLIFVLLSQVSKGDQKEIGRALADAMLPPKDGRASTRADDVKKVLEANAETFFAGADIRRVADVAIAIVPIPGSEDSSGNRLRSLVLSKDRGHSWSTFEEGGKRVLSFRMGASGAFQNVAFGVSGLPDSDPFKASVPSKGIKKQGRGAPPVTEEEVP